VIFDVDGVLVNSEPLHQRAWKQVLKELGISLSNQQFRLLMGKTTDQIMSMFFEQHDIREDVSFWSYKKDEVYRTLVHKELKPLEGVVPFLLHLKARQVKIGVASSAVRKNVQAALDCLGVEDGFNVVLSVEDITHPKPDPEIYLKAAQSLGLAASDCVVIEDSLPGIQSAKQAGTFVIGITTNFASEALAIADHVCLSFPEIHQDRKSVV
jgi:HAD superfamily hydrolase (TIGR01509 family)